MRPLITGSLILATMTVIGCSQDVSTSEPTATPSTETPAETSTPNTTANADTPATTAIYEKDGVAIAGADPVAYFTEGAYVPGSGEFAYDWNGVSWQFASAENRDTFASDPEAYMPEYGGFCAWAVTQGNKAPIDPTAWKIVDGKLYLNYDAKIQTKWAQDIPGNIAKADAKWPEVSFK